MFHNKMLYVPFCLWLTIQIFKVIYELSKNGEIDPKRLVGAGGMPSAHSAVVSCLAMLIGKKEGFNSSMFALAVIFALIVMYDACGVRRAAGKQAKVLNKMIEKQEAVLEEEKPQKLTELLGHNPLEVVVGAILGISIGYIA